MVSSWVLWADGTLDVKLNLLPVSQSIAVRCTASRCLLSTALSVRAVKCGWVDDDLAVNLGSLNPKRRNDETAKREKRRLVKDVGGRHRPFASPVSLAGKQDPTRSDDLNRRPPPSLDHRDDLSI